MDFTNTVEATLWERLAARMLLAAGGPRPRHIAIIMDGNRRYGQEGGVAHADSYTEGMMAFQSAVGWCALLGIAELSVYAFSIENFKRSQAEVNFLFKIAERECRRILTDIDDLNEKGVRFCFLGHLSYLPVGAQRVCAQLAHATRGNSKIRVNLCIAYTARQELADVTRAIQAGYAHLKPNTPLDKQTFATECDESLVDQLVYTQGHPVDLLVRTSGEQRLSDFLLWQTSYTALCFVDIKWPQFTYWRMLAAILYYQTQHSRIVTAHKKYLRAEVSCLAERRGLKVASGPGSWAGDILKLARESDAHYVRQAARGTLVRHPLPVDEDN